jgi:hypothetical protein
MVQATLTSQGMVATGKWRANRSANIDLCRGLLFVLMANTHALSLVGVPSDHFLSSDLWLPSGWATAIFVVLSGFSVGFVCSDRPDLKRLERPLLRRSLQIFFVMVLSNSVFAVLREVVGGNAAAVASPLWWLGFLTLDTGWTISGVLLPTALVVALGIPLSRLARYWPWIVLPVLIILRVACTITRIDLEASGYSQYWIVRLLFLEGLGGFPVLPFVLNGFLGVWLGVLRNHSEAKWRIAILSLLLLQVGVYLTSFFPQTLLTTIYVLGCGPIGKFAWMYLMAHLVKLSALALARPIELIGNFALGSFVMHRFFLHGLNQTLDLLGLRSVSSEWQYVLLLSLTLLLTWLLCMLRRRYLFIDRPFRRLAL